MIAERLTKYIGEVCPLVSVSIGRKDDAATWSLDFAPDATPEQRAAATARMATIDAAAWLADEARAETIAAIKANANADIEATVGSLFKQLNRVVSGIMLIVKAMGGVQAVLSKLSKEEQQATQDALKAWQYVEQRRAQSDAEEAQVK